MNAMDSQPPMELPPAPPRRGFVSLGVMSLLFALAFLPAPLAVLYELNDECLRMTSWGSNFSTWQTLAGLPPMPVGRFSYLLVRTAVLVAIPASLLLGFAAIVSFRSRPWAIRFHALYAPIQIILMSAMLIGANRFSTALDAAAATQDLAMRLPYHSNVRTTAALVALPGLAYPVALAFAYWLYGLSNTRRPAR
jgi:hypothetical protein